MKKLFRESLLALVVGVAIWLACIYAVERYLPGKSAALYMCLGMLADGIAKGCGALARWMFA
jgi:hypothetical protein